MFLDKCGMLPGALPTVLQQLLQARQVVAPHLSGRVLPLPLDLGADHLGRSLPALLQVAQHVACHGKKEHINARSPGCGTFFNANKLKNF